MRTIHQISVQRYNKFFKFANFLAKKMLSVLVQADFCTKKFVVCTKVRTYFRGGIAKGNVGVLEITTNLYIFCELRTTFGGRSVLPLSEGAASA